MYRVELDWRPLDVQIAEMNNEDNMSMSSSISSASPAFGQTAAVATSSAAAAVDVSVVKSEASTNLLETVVEGEGEGFDEDEEITTASSNAASSRASPSRAMSIRSGASTPPSSIALNDTYSVADSDREFYRNIHDEGTIDRHVETFLLNEAAKGRDEQNNSGSMSPSHSSAFSPASAAASAARTPLMSNQKAASIPEIGLGASAYTASSDDQALDGLDVSSSLNNSSMVSSLQPKKNTTIAYVKSDCVFKFTPPLLPQFEPAPEGNSIFSFFGKGGEQPREPAKVGDNVKTAYGTGKVLEVREDEIVVVSMDGWTAKAYLREGDVEVIKEGGRFFGLFGGFGNNKANEEQKEETVKIGDNVKTAYGTGKVGEVREDEMVVVNMDGWTAKAYLRVGDVEVIEIEKPEGGGFFGLFRRGKGGAADQEKLVKVGDSVKTAYGTGKVEEVREDEMVVVDMDEWTAKAYLRIGDIEVEVIEKEAAGGFFRLFGSRMSGKEVIVIDDDDKDEEEDEGELFNVGEELETAFGMGTVVDIREETAPVVVKIEDETDNPDETETESESVGKVRIKVEEGEEKEGEDKEKEAGEGGVAVKGGDTDGKEGSIVRVSSTDATNGSERKKYILTVELEGWGAKLYCTQVEANRWRKKYKKKHGQGFFGVIGHIVRRMTAAPPKRESPVPKTPPMLSEQYYCDAASVEVGSMGKGIVEGFRGVDNIYTVRLSFGISYVHRDNLSHWVEDGCEEGASVLCYVGGGKGVVTGELDSVDEKSGVHKVVVKSGGMTCYLNPKSIVRRITAQVADEVHTGFGDGTVVGYRMEDGMFVVRLGWGATVYCLGSDLERVEKDVDGGGTGGLGGWLSGLWGAQEVGKGAKVGRRSRAQSISSEKGGLAAIAK